jgi:hypothetical protein
MLSGTLAKGQRIAGAIASDMLARSGGGNVEPCAAANVIC